MIRKVPVPGPYMPSYMPMIRAAKTATMTVRRVTGTESFSERLNSLLFSTKNAATGMIARIMYSRMRSLVIIERRAPAKEPRIAAATEGSATFRLINPFLMNRAVLTAVPQQDESLLVATAA